jgi:hypothetical protein
MRTIPGYHVVFSVVLFAGGACIASCISGTQSPEGKKAADVHDAGLHPNATTSAVIASSAASAMTLGAMSANAAPRPPSRGRTVTRSIGISSSLRARRPSWSRIAPDANFRKTSPKRRCTKDDECGDGFCDRGGCAPIWSCHSAYGQQCQANIDCHRRPCVHGRCRSCVSNAECAPMSEFFESELECVPDSTIPGARQCVGEEEPSSGGPGYELPAIQVAAMTCPGDSTGKPPEALDDSGNRGAARRSRSCLDHAFRDANSIRAQGLSAHRPIQATHRAILRATHQGSG